MKIARQQHRRWLMRVGLPHLVLGAALAWAVPAVVAADPGEPLLPADPLVGRRVFVEKGCLKCHAIWGEGGDLGPDLGKAGVWHSVLQLAGVLWSHSPEMIEKMRERHIARETISAEEMAELAAFLYFLNYFDPPGDPVVGEKLFAQKGCVRCHRVGGTGGNVGPPLDGYRRYASPVVLVGAMWGHGPSMAGRMSEQGLAWPEFGETDIRDIFAYIRTAAKYTTAERVYLIPGSPARGKAVFAKKGCGGCHSVRGENGGIGPGLMKPALRKSVTAIAGRMWNHQPGMIEKMRELDIPLPEFTQEEISDLIAYLFFLQYSDLRGDKDKGARLYMHKGCVLCHYAPPGTKEKAGAPDLASSPIIFSPLELAAALWNHAPAMEEEIRRRGLAWPRFHDDEVRDLVEYLRSVAPESP